MIVRTEFLFRNDPERIWPRLCHATMDTRRPCLFRFGIPKPVECRLPSEHGEVGATRECVSDHGTIQQRILEWVPPARLKFEMVSTDLDFRRHVDTLVDTFELRPLGPESTLVIRTSELRLHGPLAWIRAPGLWIGMKQVHRYVFQNWATLDPPRQLAPFSKIHWLWRGSYTGLRTLLGAILIGSIVSGTLTAAVILFGVSANGTLQDYLLGVSLLAAMAGVVSLFGVVLIGVPAYLLLARFDRAGAIPLVVIGFVAGASLSLPAIGSNQDSLFASLCAIDGAAAAFAARWWIDLRRTA